MSHVLQMAARQFRSPMGIFIEIKADDRLNHVLKDPPGVELRFGAGFHQRKIVKAIAQHTTEAMIRGQSLSKWRARAASIAADKIQSWARLIITSMTRRACQTAVRPRSSCRLGAEGRS